MLTKVEIRTRQGNSLAMPFEDWDNGLGIASIEGLDPTKATIVSSGFANQDGEQYHSSKRESRDLKFKIDIVPDFVQTSAKSLRNKLYQFLMPKALVTCRFYDELGSYVDVVGRVESFDAPLFTEEPVATVSLRCLDPDFFDPNPSTQTGLTVTGSTVTMTTIPYLGSVETGILFTLMLDRNLNSFSVVHQTPFGDTFQLDFAETLLAGDELTISTISGSKGTSLKRGSSVTSLLYGVNPTSKWLELEGPGDNYIRVSAPAAGVPWKIQYVNRYGGL